MQDLPEDMIDHATTPKAAHLFYTRAGAMKLSDQDKGLFHMWVAKLLFLIKQARPDILMAIYFLCTRVHIPDQYDYEMLCWVVQYIWVTKQLWLALEIQDIAVIEWWVDAAYAPHPDMRSHTGQILSLVSGAVYLSYSKQKINTWSST